MASFPRYSGGDAMIMGFNTWYQVLNLFVEKADTTYAMSVLSYTFQIFDSLLNCAAVMEEEGALAEFLFEAA